MLNSHNYPKTYFTLDSEDMAYFKNKYSKYVDEAKQIEANNKEQARQTEINRLKTRLQELENNTTK